MPTSPQRSRKRPACDTEPVRMPWTKQPKYQGHQFTFDSNNEMRQVRIAKSQVSISPQGASSADISPGAVTLSRSGSGNCLPPEQEGMPGSSASLSPSVYNFRNDASKDTLQQPDTRPISQEQLINEVKGIYAGLVMVEKKCVEVSQSQAGNKLSNEQWQALIALHRTLLHEHHDFFLASQHPTASRALRRLPMQYAMPARMWRHGIQSFLELLRHRMPHSLEYFTSFVYLAHEMLTLSMETCPEWDDWSECLADLDGYRLAIEKADKLDRETWSLLSPSRHRSRTPLDATDPGSMQSRLRRALADPDLVLKMQQFSEHESPLQTRQDPENSEMSAINYDYTAEKCRRGIQASLLSRECLSIILDSTKVSDDIALNLMNQRRLAREAKGRISARQSERTLTYQ